MKRRKNKQVALAVLLSAALVTGTLVGCGQQKEEKSETAPTTEKQEKVEVKGTPVTLKLFTMTCPEGWTVNEEEKKDEDRDAKMVIDLKDGDQSLVNLEVRVEDENASAYRRILRGNNIDAYEMIEKNAYTIKNIGGIDTVECGEEGRLLYLGRNESSHMTVTIIAKGDVTDPKVEEAVSTITFTLPDEGQTDPPWAWDGERFSMDEEHTITVGDKNIKAEYIPFDEPLIVDERSTGRAELVGDSLWVLLDNRLYEYSTGENFTFVKEVELPESAYQELSSDVNGNLYVSSNGSMHIIKDGGIVASSSDVHKTIIDKSGTFGVSTFSGRAPEKVTLSDNTVSVTEWNFIEKEKINIAGLTKNYMYVAGKDPETKNQALWIYDKDGNLKMTLGNVKVSEPCGMSSLYDVIETDSGFMALDISTKKLLLWKTDGTIIGEIKHEDIFGTDFPALTTATLGDDGSIYIGLTEERADQSAEEFVIYRLTGF